MVLNDATYKKKTRPFAKCEKSRRQPIHAIHAIGQSVSYEPRHPLQFYKWFFFFEYETLSVLRVLFGHVFLEWVLQPDLMIGTLTYNVSYYK
jgi:hypothetical protein